MLSRYGIATVDSGTSSGLPDPESGENLEIDGLVKIADVYAKAAREDLRMRLVTYDEGKVGYVDGQGIRPVRRADDAGVVRARRR